MMTLSPSNRTPADRITRLAVFVGLCVIGLAHGCSKDDAAPVPAVSKPPPILLIAADGLEWDVMLPMLHEGRLPEMGKLIQRGCYGLLESFEPTMSPIIWTSVATGKSLDKHGIRHFVKRSQPGGPMELYSNRDRKTKAIWNIAGDFQKRVAVIGWWMTFPVEPVNGVMVAQTNTADPFELAKGGQIWKGRLMSDVPGQVYPPQRQDEIMKLLAEVEASLPELIEHIFGRFPHPQSRLEQRLWDNCLWSFRADATYLRIANVLLDDPEPYDLLAVYLGGPDVAGHRFWRYWQPELYENEPAPEQVANFGQVIEDYYVYVDQAIGELVAKLGPDVRVVVVSDHGMTPVRRWARFDPDDPPNMVVSAHHFDAPPGVIIAAGPDIRRIGIARPPAELQRSDLTTPASVMDITPTLLFLMNLPVGQDMQGCIAADLITPEFLADHPAKTVPTHDTETWIKSHQALTGKDLGHDERLEQLRSLGYIDD